MAQDPTEAAIDQEHEMSLLRERQTKLETSMGQLADTTRQLADIQREQGKSITAIHTDVQMIATAMRSAAGKVNIGSALTVLVPLATGVAFIAALWIAPLSARVEANEKELQKSASAAQAKLDAFTESDGTVKVQVRLAVNDAKMAQLEKLTTSLADSERRRLEEEAAAGRQAIYNKANEKK